MPFCKISKEVSLHYITNTPNGDVTDLDDTKPTILLISPIFCDVSWFREQFKDVRLSGHYNLVAFDQRNSGKTISPFSSKRDAYVDAADLAVAHELLQLPPCHIFSVSTNACGAAYRLGMLWPDKCLSLCLCSTPNQPGEDPEWVPQGYIEMLEAWCFPQDLDTLERACMEFSWLMFNGQISTELEDDIVAWWQVNLPPRKRTQYLAQVLCGMNRHRLTDKQLTSIQLPTLFVKSDMSLQNPPIQAQAICDKMPNARMFVVKGGPELFTLVPEYASVTHRVYTQFLKGVPTPPVSQRSRPNPTRVCAEALKRLATLTDDPSIAKRDPTTTLSFCQFTPEVIQRSIDMFAQYSKGEKEAFNALNEHGQPIRKFSQRNQEQFWAPSLGQHVDASDAMAITVESSSKNDSVKANSPTQFWPWRFGEKKPE